MLCFPNAKINLGLNIISKRADGYHNIETIFCPVDLSDILEFVTDAGHGDGFATLTSTGVPVECPDENNLCLKAYYLLCRDFKLPAVNIHLHKLIPPGAGLGGGSSDAAFMLKHLNVIYELGINEDKLCDYASELGSDCAFFIKNRPLLGFERGNRFKEITMFSEDLSIVIVNPKIHIDTAKAYSFVHPKKPPRPLKELISFPVSQWKNSITNDFEESIIKKHPIVGDIKKKLYEAGVLYASMSGSGSSVFGLFSEKVPDVHVLFPELYCWSGKLYQGDSFSE
jgi:4-diphosphocytidyl-2-C-methyl-D-erythritol kinase